MGLAISYTGRISLSFGNIHPFNRLLSSSRTWLKRTLEVPVTIRNPDQPIGTHVFTAVARAEAGLRWTAVTIDSGDSAQAALDRITIPQDVLDRIAPTALPRSSIIISDEPLSAETNYRTEFTAVLSNQPQGGFITRKPTEVRIADDRGFFNFSRQRTIGVDLGARCQVRQVRCMRTTTVGPIERLHPLVRTHQQLDRVSSKIEADLF